MKSGCLSIKGYGVEGGGITSMYCYGSCYSQRVKPTKKCGNACSERPKVCQVRDSNCNISGHFNNSWTRVS